MTDQVAQTMKDNLGFVLPTPEAGRKLARQRLSATFQKGELVWLLGEHYDANTPAWNIDILRQGASGQWVRQRYRFDEQAEVLYFMGESALSDSEFRLARQ